MTIEKILRGLKYRNLEIEDDINCTGVNVIYGANGSGKTTLSEALRNLDDPSIASYLAAKGLLESYVFNSEYVDGELREFTSGAAGVPSIAIGKGDIEQQALKIQFESEISAAGELADRLSGLIAKLKTEQKVGESAKALVIEKLSGQAGYNSYQYKNNAALIGRIAKAEPCADASELKRSEQLLSVDAPEPLSLASIRKDAIQSAVADAYAIALEEPKVRGAELPDLDPDYREWLRKGLDYMDSDGAQDGCCPFCLGQVDVTRSNALEETFESETASLINRATDGRKILSNEKERMVAVRLEWLSYASIKSPYEPDIEGLIKEFADWLDKVEKTLNKAMELIDWKLANPSTSWPGAPISVSDFDLDPLNEAIKRHNDGCGSHASNRNNAVKLVEDHYLSEFTGELSRVREEKQRYQRAFDALVRRKRAREAALARLRSEMSSKVESAEKITSILHRSLGVPRISLRVSSDELTYHLERDGGAAAQHLSEGERQAIALAYFVQSLEADHVRPSESIVVFDDPVVALDDHRMNVALYMIREATKDFSQIFLSTHNFQVLKRASRVWATVNNDEITYMESRKDEAGVCSIHPLPSRYLEFAGEYHYLFARMAAAAFGAEVEISFDSRNVARRVLESFLEFQVPMRNGSLRSMLESAWDAEGSLEKFAPLVRGVVATYNSGSHSVPAAPSLDLWTFPTREEVRLCYGIMILLNRNHARNMLKAVFSPDEHEKIHDEAKKYAKKVTGIENRIKNGVDPRFEVMLPPGKLDSELEESDDTADAVS